MKKFLLTLALFQLLISSNLFARDNGFETTQYSKYDIEKQQKRVVDIKGIDVYPENYAKKLTQRAARTFASKYSADFISTFILTHTVEANGKYRELFVTESLLQSYEFNQKLALFINYQLASEKTGYGVIGISPKRKGSDKDWSWITITQDGENSMLSSSVKYLTEDGELLLLLAGDDILKLKKYFSNIDESELRAVGDNTAVVRFKLK